MAKKLRSRVVGLAYYDAQSGGAVWVSLVKDSTGALVGNNQVLYEDAFADVKADVRYTYTRHGLEQDVILRQNDLPLPDAFGLNPKSTRLEVVTEFLQPPAPVLHEGVIEGEQDAVVRRTMVAPDFSDQVISFGAMHIGQSKAFMLGDEAAEIAVGKSWSQIGGRTFLVEAVKFEEVRTRVQALPKAVAPIQRQAQKIQPQKDMFAQVAPAPQKKPGELLRMAQLPKSNEGLVLDYSVVSSQSGLTFKGDTTYYVSGPVNLSGTTTIEGGVVIKYAKTGSPQITINSAGSTIQCLTAPYRPAIFTSKDDNTVGESISGSAGNPSGTYAVTALNIDANAIASSVNLSNLRFRNAQTAMYLNTGSHTLSHMQFLNCTYAISPPHATLTLRNILANQITAFFNLADAAIANGEHLTLHNVGSLYNSFAPAVTFINSLLAKFTTSPVGSYTAVNSPYIPDDTGVFQTVGSGSHYLAANSPYRDAGTPNISSVMLGDLATRTTFPPQERNGGTYSADWIVSPTVSRDNDGQPDCGYHYEALDWLATGVTMNSSATVIVTNGAALGIQFNGGAGISLADSAKFVSQGSATSQNFVGRAHLVQEQPSSATAGWMPLVTGFTSYSSIRYRHTILPALAGGHHYFYGGAQGPLEFSHCDLKCGKIWHGQLSSSARQIGLTNNLFFRTALTLGANDQYVTLYAYNNLFVGGTVSLNPSTYNSSSWRVKDCVFDKTGISQSGYYLSGASHNGYVSGSSRISPQQSSDRVVSTINYTFGSSGESFVSDTDISSFENKGSRTVGSAGLFHFTSRVVDRQKDIGTVDIGLHYVARDVNGAPFDFDEDGLSDYVEDRDGDGDYAVGETYWQESDTDFDGLSDGYEPSHGKDPLDPDTGNTGVADGLKDEDGDGWSNTDEIRNATHPIVVTAPPVVVGIALLKTTDNLNQLVWASPSVRPISFTIERNTGSSWTVAATVAGAEDSFVDTGLSPGTTASYRIKANYPSGSSAFSSTVVSSTEPTYTIPAAVAKGPGGRLFLISSELPAELDGLVLRRTRISDLTPKKWT